MKRAILFMVITVVLTGTVVMAQRPQKIERSVPGESPVLSHFAGKNDVVNLRKNLAEQEIFISEHPNDKLGWVRLAQTYSALAESTKDKSHLDGALDAYLKASEIGRRGGRLLYTHEVAKIIVQLGDHELLDRVFHDFLSASRDRDRGNYYGALVDYADGLASFGDDSAWAYFEEAIDFYPGANIEAVNRYADWLLRRNQPGKALEVLDRIPREIRAIHRTPSILRNKAIDQLRLGIPKDQVQPMRSTENNNEKISRITALSYVHSSSTSDDCRSPGNPPRCFYSNVHQYCFPTYMVNLAEVLWNEARSESQGAKGLVGWTVRNRAYQSLSCDAYPGGVGSPCVTSLLCSESGRCDLSRRYCCAIHGGTTSPGSPQWQFNDTHVNFSDLEMSNLLYMAYLIVEGRVPDVSTGHIPQGVSGCNLNCDVSYCSSGFNWTSASPSGPMEFRGNNYCAVRQQCKWYAKNVCGNLGKPSSCSSPVNGGDNHFWNRVP